MVVIRLVRVGANKSPFYHVVVADQRFSRNGRYIVRVGYFNPVAHGENIRLKLDRDIISEWIKKGAQPSPRVGKLLKEYEKIGPDVKGATQDERIQVRHKIKATKKATAAKVAAEEAQAEAGSAEQASE